MDLNTITFRVMNLIVMVLSLTVHEWAHAYSAFRMGDTTARDQGRMTLNPLVHIDPMGTFLLPLVGAPVGWARPVPFNPSRFNRSIPMRTGTMITKAAGPLSNVVLAFLCIVALGLLERANGFGLMNGALVVLLRSGVRMNAGLAVFNAIPLEPLDGAGVLDRFIPDSLRPGWEQLQSVGSKLLMVLFIVQMMTGGAMGIGWVLGAPVSGLINALASLARAIGLGL